jgi:transglutaminase/protease-like cytokinesis protein 3
MRISLLAFAFLTIVSCVLGQVEDFTNIDFRKADSIARLYPNHSLDDLRSLAVKLTVPLPTDVEKFRAIYTWTCLNIANDYVLFDKNRRMREKFKNNPEELKSWNKGFSRTVFETLRKKKRTVCTGYAYLLRELASHVGISCVIVDGYGRNAIANISGSGSVNHSWTAVHLDNKWYLCDATWSSGAMDMEQKDFVKTNNK